MTKAQTKFKPLRVNGEIISKADLIRRVVREDPDLTPKEIIQKLREEVHYEPSWTFVNQTRDKQLERLKIENGTASETREVTSSVQTFTIPPEAEPHQEADIVDGLYSLQLAVKILGGRETVKRILDVLEL